MDSHINPYESPREISAPSNDRVGILKPIRISGALSWEEGRLALRVESPKAFWFGGRPPTAVRRWIMMASVTLLIGLASIHPSSPGPYLGLLIVTGLAFAFIRQRLLLRRLWRQHKGMFAPFEQVISDAGIDQVSEDITSSAPWSAFSKFRRYKDLALLYFGPAARFVVFSKDLFPSEEAWQSFTGFLQARFPED